MPLPPTEERLFIYGYRAHRLSPHDMPIGERLGQKGRFSEKTSCFGSSKLKNHDLTTETLRHCLKSHGGFQEKVDSPIRSFKLMFLW
jgi:hypothetical protein